MDKNTYIYYSYLNNIGDMYSQVYQIFYIWYENAYEELDF
jgi:hypothetical protein